MLAIVSPFYPIIYVRGFAGNDEEIESTVADPYMGFNLGSTKFRQTWTGQIERHFFESPLYRLVKDFGYRDVYTNGQYMPPDVTPEPRSIIVYRYYDEQFFDALAEAGEVTHPSEIQGLRRDVEEFAEGLSKLILQARDRICGDDDQAKRDFKVCLVGHSMGGLVCRCFLQNPKVGTQEAKKLVTKVFTYATPHNGIDFRIIGNVPGFFSHNDVNNFNRDRMRAYLGLPDGEGDVCDLNGHFDPDRFFCLVGTNWRDYLVTGGWSKRLTGPMSDGLVRIANATVYGKPKGQRAVKHSPRAFVHRSHSGHYGIVNSEEGYQNLTRFLFGDVRVDGILKVEELSLPSKVAKAQADGEKIRASYHFEVVVRVRGVEWDLHRRTAAEESAIFRTFDQMFPDEGKARSPHLFSVFLSTNARVKKKRPSLGFQVDLTIRVPDYEVDGFLWRNEHYEGSYLLQETITIEATPEKGAGGIESYKLKYGVRHGAGGRNLNQATKVAALNEVDGSVTCEIPLDSKTTPGFKGALQITARPWE